MTKNLLHKILHVSFRRKLPMTALKFLDLQQQAGGMLPCPRQNLPGNPRTNLVKASSKKRVSISLLTLFALCLCVGCADNSEDDSDIYSLPDAGKVSADTKTFSMTLAEKSDSEPDTFHTESETALKTILWEAPNGEIFYMEDGIREGSEIVFDKAVYRPSTGAYYDSLRNPELFDSETNEFLGEKREFDKSEFVIVQSGDVINGYTVEQARLAFNSKEKYFLSNSVLFKDNVTLTGIIRYYNFDDPTAIQKGDILFIPDNSYMDMPLMQLIDCNGVIKDKSFPAVYSDSMWISLGNFFRDYADNEEIRDIINDRADSIEVKAEVVIGGLSLVFADSMGTAATFGKIISINEIF